jgi:predicted dehydrogenase
MKKNHSAISRRTFIKTTGSMAVTATLPGWAKSVYAQEEQKTSGSPNDKIQIGLVGCGGQGSRDAANAEYKGAKIVAICDVDAQHMAVAQEKFPDAQGYADFRELLRRDDVDAVICGTVDHWHTLVSMASMRAGKDIYCEKPLTLTLDEGKRLVNMQKETGRVFQTGTQQRSSDYFRTACNLVRNKRIGEIKEVEVWVPAGLRQGPFQSTAIPEGFNYDFWLGQTPEVPYVKERTHFSFRYWWEYSGGTMTDWGAHHNDIVLWALDMDGSGPVAIEGKPLIDMIPGGFTATSEFEVQFTYANGVVHTCRSTTDSEWNGYPKNPDGQQHGIKFIGSEGWIWVTRGKIEASSPEILEEALPSDAKLVYESTDHMRNFLDCVRTRNVTICPAEVGHRSVSVGHLGVIAMHLGRKLEWDPQLESFIGDEEAQRHRARPMRGPYTYDMV